MFSIQTDKEPFIVIIIVVVVVVNRNRGLDFIN